MKKILILCTAAIMLMSILAGCKKAEEPVEAPEPTPEVIRTPTPTPTPEPTPEPEPERPQDEPAELAKAYCEKMGYPYDTNFDPIFAQAVSTLPTDFTAVSKDLPMQLYLLPYNIGISLADGAENEFTTNVKLTEELGADKISEIAAQAVQWEKTSGTILQHKDEDYYLSEYALCNVKEDEAAEYAAYLMDCAEEHHMTQYRFFVTDSSLVYRAANGNICVKGRCFYVVKKADKAYFKDFPEEEAGQWYYGDAEVRFKEVSDGLVPTITYELSPFVAIDEANTVFVKQFESTLEPEEAHEEE